MFLDFLAVFIFCVLALGFVAINLLIARILSRKRPDPVKQMPYECGIEPSGPAWVKFNPRFYLFALLFLVFDVEAALIFPVAGVFRSWAETGAGWVAFAETAVFVLILLVALIYAWGRGDLEWVRFAGRDESGRASS